MIDLITDTLQPLIVELLLALILAALAWIGRFLPERLRLDVEARHRAALHSALETGVGYALDLLGAAMKANPAVATSDAAIGRVIDYVERSVPDAIRKLGPSRETLTRMARAKMTDALIAAGLDPLSNALRDAGVDVSQ